MVGLEKVDAAFWQFIVEDKPRLGWFRVPGLWDPPRPRPLVIELDDDNNLESSKGRPDYHEGPGYPRGTRCVGRVCLTRPGYVCLRQIKGLVQISDFGT